MAGPEGIKEVAEFTFAPDEPYRFVYGDLVSFVVPWFLVVKQRSVGITTTQTSPTLVKRVKQLHAAERHYGVILSGPHFDGVNVWPGEFDQGKDYESLGIQAVDVKWRCFDYARCVEIDIADIELQAV